MSKLAVKIKTGVLIEALEQALAERKKRWANQEKEKTEHEKKVEAYNQAILKIVKSGKATLTSADEGWASRGEKGSNKTFNVTVEIPKKLVPIKPEEVETYPEYKYQNETQEISSSIRVLKMTDQEYVSASTYKSVTQYL